MVQEEKIPPIFYCTYLGFTIYHSLIPPHLLSVALCVLRVLCVRLPHALLAFYQRICIITHTGDVWCADGYVRGRCVGHSYPLPSFSVLAVFLAFPKSVPGKSDPVF